MARGKKSDRLTPIIDLVDEAFQESPPIPGSPGLAPSRSMFATNATPEGLYPSNKQLRKLSAEDQALALEENLSSLVEKTGIHYDAAYLAATGEGAARQDAAMRARPKTRTQLIDNAGYFSNMDPVETKMANVKAASKIQDRADAIGSLLNERTPEYDPDYITRHYYNATQEPGKGAILSIPLEERYAWEKKLLAAGQEYDPETKQWKAVDLSPNAGKIYSTEEAARRNNGAYLNPATGEITPPVEFVSMDPVSKRGKTAQRIGIDDMQHAKLAMERVAERLASGSGSEAANRLEAKGYGRKVIDRLTRNTRGKMTRGTPGDEEFLSSLLDQPEGLLEGGRVPPGGAGLGAHDVPINPNAVPFLPEALERAPTGKAMNLLEETFLHRLAKGLLRKI